MSTTTTVICGGIGIILLFLWQRKISKEKHRQREEEEERDGLPPKINRPLLEVVAHLVSKGGPEYFLKIQRQMNNVDVMRLPFQPPNKPNSYFFVVGNYHIARKILEHPKSIKEAFFYKLFDQTANSKSGKPTFFSTDDPIRYLHVRKATASCFSSNNLKQQAYKIEEIVEEWIQNVLQPKIEKHVPIDIAEEMLKITIQIIIRIGFEDYNRLTTEEEQIACGKWLKDCYQEYGRDSALNPLHQIPIINYYCFESVRKAKYASKQLYNLAKKMLHRHREEKAKTKKKQQQQQDSTTAATSKSPPSIVAALDNDDQYASDEERISDLVIYLIGGFDTTAYTLSWMFYELTNHMSEQDKLRNALIGYSRANENDEKKTNDDSRECPEIKCIIKETLRLHPTAAFGSARKVTQDIVISLNDEEDGDEVMDDDTIVDVSKDDTREETMKNDSTGRDDKENNKSSDKNTNTTITIPKNSYCLCVPYLVHRNGKVFDNPDTFQPHRWDFQQKSTFENDNTATIEQEEEEENQKKKKKKIVAQTKSYFPFSAGRRGCQGQLLAMIEFQIIISKLFQNYTWERVVDGETDYYVTLKHVHALYKATPLSGK